MPLNVNLVIRSDSTVTLIPLHDVVFEGGEPHLGVIARCRLAGEEIMGSVIKVEPTLFPPASGTDASGPQASDSGTVTIERIDDGIVTDEPGISFLGEPPHATPATDTLDLSAPSQWARGRRRGSR